MPFAALGGTELTLVTAQSGNDGSEYGVQVRGGTFPLKRPTGVTVIGVLLILGGQSFSP